jgi:hypothetical protein
MYSKCNKMLRQAGVGAILLGSVGAATVSAQTVTTITGSNPATVNNCFPFGSGVLAAGVSWPPNYGFIYQNLPAFDINPGDILAFDTGALNDVPVELQIEMAATTVNGGDIPGAYTTLVSNTQTPVNPLGDAIVGNFEMQFTAEAAFSFPGGGLSIRFSNPSAAYTADVTCNQNLAWYTSADPSGLFVKRFRDVDDGLPPWTAEATNAIGGFQVTNIPPPVIPPEPPEPTPPAPPEPVPVLGAGALGMTAFMLMIAGFLGLRRQGVRKKS